MKCFRKKCLACIVIFLVSLFLANLPLSADNNDFEELLKKGIAQFKHENYDEALSIFRELTESDPRSSLAAYYMGLTYKRLEDYVSAVRHLKASLTLTPKIKGALIELIDTLYRLDKVEEAKEWIKVAEQEGVRPAQAAFLKGLTLVKAEEFEAAVEAFSDAKKLDPQFAQLADYQIGIAYVKMDKIDEAGDAFKNIIALDPHTDIAEYATRYLDAIDKKREREKPLKLTFRSAFEYDSNVLLKPGDTSLVTQITDQDDTRQVYELKADHTLRAPDKRFSLKSSYGIRYSKQNDFGRFDIVSNSFSLQPSISLKKIRFSFPISYNHTIVDEKNYLSAVSARNLNNIILGKSQMAQVGILYKRKDYLRPPFGDEDRTGNELIGIGGLFWFFANNEGFVSLRYSANKDWTKGANWDYWGNKVSAGLLVPFWERFKFNAQGEVYLQEYENVHTLLDDRRRDQVYSASSLLSYEFIKNAEIQSQYTYVNQRSNIGLYQYDRHIVSVAIQYKF